MCNGIVLIPYTWGGMSIKKEKECFLKTGTIYTTIKCAVPNHSCSRIQIGMIMGAWGLHTIIHSASAFTEAHKTLP